MKLQAPRIEEEIVVRPIDTAKIESVRVEGANDAKDYSSTSSSGSRARDHQVRNFFEMFFVW